MVERTDGIVQFIVIKKSQFVVDLRIPNIFGIIERGFVQVDRALKISTC